MSQCVYILATLRTSMCNMSSLLYDQYNDNISEFNTFTLEMICVAFMGPHNSSCVIHNSRHCLIKLGQFPSCPPARCGHASAVSHNPPHHLHLQVGPFWGS